MSMFVKAMMKKVSNFNRIEWKVKRVFRCKFGEIGSRQKWVYIQVDVLCICFSKLGIRLSFFGFREQ